MQSKVCSKCKIRQPLAEFYVAYRSRRLESWCRSCKYKSDKARRTPESRKLENRSNILRKYGLTIQGYDALLKSQGGVCAICGRTSTTGRNLAVDHDHTSGRIRGLLCDSCNGGLGLLQDSEEILEKALAYLRRSTGYR